MKIIVRAKPNSKENSVEKISESEFLVRVKSPPVDGKANAAIVKVLAEYFSISPSLVEIVSGYFSNTKVVRVHSG